ncbi:MAG TPA: hypothetical protein VFT74_11730 [Isosphaeraceae bacterium]|nr:hypothetical protein [Isosphaeraceae bacterium]
MSFDFTSDAYGKACFDFAMETCLNDPLEAARLALAMRGGEIDALNGVSLLLEDFLRRRGDPEASTKARDIVAQANLANTQDLQATKISANDYSRLTADVRAWIDANRRRPGNQHDDTIGMIESLVNALDALQLSAQAQAALITQQLRVLSVSQLAKTMSETGRFQAVLNGFSQYSRLIVGLNLDIAELRGEPFENADAWRAYALGEADEVPESVPESWQDWFNLPRIKPEDWEDN